MPSRSKRQASIFRVAAHHAGYAKRIGIDQKKARAWAIADRKAGRFQDPEPKGKGRK